MRQDRTYASVIALRDWFQHNRITPTKAHLITRGPHARRSRLLLERVLGEQVQVGVTAVPTPTYDNLHWWRSSAGVRDVIGEALAYAYVLGFGPEPEAASSGNRSFGPAGRRGTLIESPWSWPTAETFPRGSGGQDP